MKWKNRATISAAVAGLAMLASEPTFATTTTAAQFAQTVVASLQAGDVRAARLMLRKVHALGVISLSFGGTRVSIETLIDQLRDGNPKPAVVIGKLTHAGAATFVWCDHWASKVNLAAPPPEVFPTSSSGCA